MAIPQTPRRSRRFQPLATPFLQRQTVKPECTWEGEPINTRPCNPELDLMQEERDEREEANQGEEEDSDTEKTVFYSAFTIKVSKPKQLRTKQASGGDDDEVRTFRLGDTITIETDTLSRQRRPPSVAVIVSMWEVRKGGEELTREHDSSKMRLRVHWFLRPSELAAIREKREHAENEVYYTLTSSDILLPNVIVSRCSVSSQRSHVNTKGKARAKNGWEDAPDSDDEEDDELEQYYCRYAINSQRGLFYELSWEELQRSAIELARHIPENIDAQGTWGSGLEWNVDTTENSAPPPKKRAKLAAKAEAKDELEGGAEEDVSEEEVDSGSEAQFESDSDDDEDIEEDAVSEDGEGGEDEDDYLHEPQTPSRKRKRGQAGPKTPRKGRKPNLAQPTPHSKAALKRRRNLKAPINASPRKQRAGNFTIRPPTLLFKADMSHLPQDPWLRAMHVLHVGNRPEALPCRGGEYDQVLRSVGELLEEGSGGCIYISGVPGTGKTATVHTAVRELKRMAEANEISPFTYVEINGLRIPEPSVAYTVLWEAISRDGDTSKESSTRISSKESLKALTHHFGGRRMRPAEHAYVVLMDELDQLVTPKQDVIYNFFNWPTLHGSKLVVIAVANTMDLPERVMTGRVRSRLGMTRINFQPYSAIQLQEIVETRLATAKEGLDEEIVARDVMSKDAIKLASAKISSITGDARRMLDACRRIVEHASTSKKTAGPGDVSKIMKMMQSSPTAGYLQDCSLHERILLASLVRCMRREGIEEIKWGDVQYQHLNYIGALTGSGDSQRKPSVAELTAVLDSLVASRAVLLEDGAAAARKPTEERRLILNIEQIEVERVLSDVGGQVWKNVLSV
ncbi:replication control protein 1 [Ephemerocybe angulata]|uniref:Origin recognition complex subunit 1 n=1 Tax=Ephemerocybe angulata TaxID=980116 RepID=A0A8H6M9T1_9AGAR|nr:replication control protein 1 [Tulosesus angulatus]